jgi:hypothetical protein
MALTRLAVWLLMIFLGSVRDFLSGAYTLRGDPKSRAPEALQTQVRQHPLSLQADRRSLALAVFSYRQ